MNQKSGVILAYIVSLRQVLNLRHCFKKKKERERENKINKKNGHLRLLYKENRPRISPSARCKTADYTHRCH